MGGWVETAFPDNHAVVDVVVSGDSFAALLTTGRRFRVLEVDEDGAWVETTRWVRAPKEGFEFVQWTDLAVIEGGYAVSGHGRLDPRRGELDSLPIFALIDVETGEHQLVIDHDRPDGGWVGDSIWFGDKLIGVGEAGTDEQPWGPGIWISSDGLVREAVPAPAEVQDVIFDLNGVAASAEMVVAVGRNNYGDTPPWVLWSPDGIEWHADLLPAVEAGEENRLFGVAYDGNEFVIIGSAGRRSESSREVRWQSEDGLAWQREDPLPSVFGDGEFRINGVWGGNGIVMLSGTSMHRSSPLYCYDDLDACRQPFTALWLRADGAWHRIVPPTEGRASYTIATDGERLITTTWSGNVGAVWVWLPGRGESELYADPFDTSPPATALPLVGIDEVIEPNTVYAYPLHTGCFGMSDLAKLNGTRWLQVEGPGWPAPTWPMFTNDHSTPRIQIVYGTIELVAPGRIEYSIPGVGAVAAYEPAPPDYQPRGCW